MLHRFTVPFVLELLTVVYNKYIGVCKEERRLFHD